VCWLRWSYQLTPVEARTIVKGGLDRHGEATQAGDIDAMMKFSDISCKMETFSGSVVATTAAEMRVICKKLVHSLQFRQVSHMVRRCLDAQFKGPETIWATYETRFIRADKEIAKDTYMSFIILNNRATGCKFSSIQVLVSDDDPISSNLKGLIQQGVFANGRI
jgi:hypothetical protein